MSVRALVDLGRAPPVVSASAVQYVRLSLVCFLIFFDERQSRLEFGGCEANGFFESVIRKRIGGLGEGGKPHFVFTSISLRFHSGVTSSSL